MKRRLVNSRQKEENNRKYPSTTGITITGHRPKLFFPYPPLPFFIHLPHQIILMPQYLCQVREKGV